MEWGRQVALLGIFSRCRIFVKSTNRKAYKTHYCQGKRKNIWQAFTTSMFLETLVLQFSPFVSHHATTDYESRSSTGAGCIQMEEGRDKKLNKQITALTTVQRAQNIWLAVTGKKVYMGNKWHYWQPGWWWERN